MTRQQLFENIQSKKSYLCIGLDTDISKIPKHLLKTEDPAFEFNRQIIEATRDYCIAYKPNLAFYEANGPDGLRSLYKTMELIRDDFFTIADAKRGDIGNTSEMYARSFFEYYHFDAVTVAPYMGKDSIVPFLSFEGKWVIVLGLTSNEGAGDFQLLKFQDNKMLFEKVLEKVSSWGNPDNTMFVIGATQAAMVKEIRKIIPEHFLLVPGVGAQGGSLKEISIAGMNNQCGLIVNSSRQIIYASSKEDFAEAAASEAKKIQREMEMYL